MKARGQDTESRVMDFYTVLERRSLLEVAREIQRELDAWKSMPLFGARVLDKLMMLHGARDLQPAWADNFILTARSFLEVLPAEWRWSIEQIAERVERAVDAEALLGS